MEEVNQEVDFEVGVIKSGEQRCNNWEAAWKKLKKFLEDGGKQSKWKSLNE